VFKINDLARAQYDTVVGCTGEIRPTNQNLDPFIKIDSAAAISIRGCVLTQSENLT
jgi:hypothetical protein